MDYLLHPIIQKIFWIKWKGFIAIRLWQVGLIKIQQQHGQNSLEEVSVVQIYKILRWRKILLS